MSRRQTRLRWLALFAAVATLAVLAASGTAGAAKQGAKGSRVSVFELPGNLLVGGLPQSVTLATANQRLYAITSEAEAAQVRKGPPYKTGPIAELTKSGDIRLIKDTLHPTDARWEGIGVGADGKVWVSATVHSEKLHLGEINGSAIKLHPSDYFFVRLVSSGGVTFALGSGSLTTKDDVGFGQVSVSGTDAESDERELGDPYALKGGVVSFGPDHDYVQIPAGTYAPPKQEVELKLPLKHIPGAPESGGRARLPVLTKSNDVWYLDEYTGEEKPRPAVMRKWGSTKAYPIPAVGVVKDFQRGPDGLPWVLYFKQGARSATLAEVEPNGKLDDVAAPKAWKFSEGTMSSGPGPYIWVAAQSPDDEHGALVRVAAG